MHTEAYQWVAKFATAEPLSVLDIAGRFVNGSPRDLFPNATSYTVLDILPGPNVDIIADAVTWDPDGRRWQLALCCEGFEHMPEWPAICATAYRALEPGGRFIVTTAAPGRPPHSGVDGGPLRFGEYYSNLEAEELRAVLGEVGFKDIVIDVQSRPNDLRATAVK